MDQPEGASNPSELDTLAALPGSVNVPGYDRSQLTAGIVHVGVGGFRRARRAMYNDRLMTAGASHD